MSEAPRGGLLAVVPARGGSKGVPRKNLQELGGRPLIAWTIEAATCSRAVGRVVVTTDDEEIASESREYGAEVPFLRPAALAEDTTPSMDVIVHALDWLAENEGYAPASVVCLQPTSPFRPASDVDAAFDLFKTKRADAVVSVSEAEQHPAWMKTLDAEGRLADLVESRERADRRQDLARVYALNGAIYLARRELLLAERTWYAGRTYGYVMPRERSLDIDTPWDLHLARLIVGDTNGDAQL